MYSDWKQQNQLKKLTNHLRWFPVDTLYLLTIMKTHKHLNTTHLDPFKWEKEPSTEMSCLLFLPKLMTPQIGCEPKTQRLNWYWSSQVTFSKRVNIFPKIPNYSFNCKRQKHIVVITVLMCWFHWLLSTKEIHPAVINIYNLCFHLSKWQHQFCERT